MDTNMEPPQKRRRVETTGPETVQSSESHSHVGSHAHSLTHLAHSDSSADLRRHPDHIQEVHMRIQSRSKIDRRQLDVGIDIGIDGESISVPTISVPVSAGISASIGASVSAGVQSGVSAGVSVSIAESASDHSQTSSHDSAQVTSAPSSNTSSANEETVSSSSSNTAVSGFGSGLRNATVSMTQAAFRPNGTDIFIATVDGTTYTVSRGRQAYTTTFANGQVAVITPSSRKATTSSASSQATNAAGSSSSENDPNTLSSLGQISAAGVATQTTFSPSSTTSSPSASNNDTSLPPAGTIAGGVVGGAAGLAVIILIAMIFLRWFRRRQQLGHHALPPNATPDPQSPPQRRSRPGMAERAGLTPLMGAIPTFFRHQNPAKEIAPAESGERGFTRISGRKLPSQFSPGMTSNPPPAAPLNDPDVERTYNNNISFYRDSNGYYGGEGTGVERQPSDASSSHIFPLGTSPEHMVLSAGPQRQPTISNGGPYAVSHDDHEYQLPPHRYNPEDDFERAVGAVPSSYESHHGETYLGSPTTVDRTTTTSPVDTFYDPSGGHGGGRGSRFTEQV
ncbi:Hypothetical protein R9X50_00129600 [Acrodontium crateriforme]|uniref:Uncharacterized protein n=1 Tax=Acrodontium crateriforme TaxID=150365 RepID=A0AAQ3R2R0_9PEZI|nr:Hypothetical protein R9X50_00129600 [Acrodontium crateriforme]